MIVVAGGRDLIAAIQGSCTFLYGVRTSQTLTFALPSWTASLHSYLAFLTDCGVLQNVLWLKRCGLAIVQAGSRPHCRLFCIEMCLPR